LVTRIRREYGRLKSEPDLEVDAAHEFQKVQFKFRNGDNKSTQKEGKIPKIQRAGENKHEPNLTARSVISSESKLTEFGAKSEGCGGFPDRRRWIRNRTRCKIAGIGLGRRIGGEESRAKRIREGARAGNALALWGVAIADGDA